MKEAENEDGEGKRKVESLWVSFRKKFGVFNFFQPVFKIHHQRSRYIYDLFYRRKAISVSGRCQWRHSYINSKSFLSARALWLVHTRGSRRRKLDCQVEETRYVPYLSQHDVIIQVTNNCAVYDASKPETPILVPLAFAAFLSPSWRREKELFSILIKWRHFV